MCPSLVGEIHLDREKVQPIGSHFFYGEMGAYFYDLRAFNNTREKEVRVFISFVSADANSRHGRLVLGRDGGG